MPLWRGCSGRGPSQRRPAAEDVWLVDGGLVVVMDEAGTVIPGGAVAVRGTRIEAVGSGGGAREPFPRGAGVSTPRAGSSCPA